ncbi:bifunctional glycosyltransferase family 2 protein/CDP-glycerol:glycerophosphate glycerophosphotransferase [Mumia sp. zg.B17]|uniref:bifunctional glycosyltransferase/CDP-glycerol:glycerophosphate glycerophosphotransferase n=1 Tax=Mumia sp. zg.B17 TaxID=2855446 RepID=UPI001C6E6646|nr:CDP-glycerol glycerophosphotransferase family protein [Mumia sp. zg.B17]MBW9204496.1 bifunctional glycosyltransferase family 2 protein/CDP-glycerol:glycerophosphate glycerophosphotransferase [Mumia sp. zg.B17]
MTARRQQPPAPSPWSRLPRPVRRLASRVRGRRTPALSVIIPVYNVEPYLRECLDSTLGQTLTSLEVIVVDDGSTDGSPDIIAEYARKDSRIRAFRQENAGQGAARNLGVEASRGEFITFLDADDTIPRGAYGYMVDSLRRSGSDFSVGSVQRVQNGRKSPAPWDESIHARDRFGVTLAEFPDALQDVIACNRMIRRDFWIEKVGGFRGGIAYEDHVPMVAAYVRADRFDILKRVTYWWRIREDNTSTGQQKHQLQNLVDRIAVKDEAHALLVDEASPEVFDAWVGRVLNLDFAPFLRHALNADDEYRRTLSAAYARYCAMATPSAWSCVSLSKKLRGWHAAKGDWGAVDLTDTYFRNHGNVPPTCVTDGRVLADLEICDRLDPALPDSLLELSTLETDLLTALLRIRWSTPTTLEVDGWALIKGIDLEHATPRLSLRLVGSSTGTVLTLDPRPAFHPELREAVAHRYQNYDAAGFVVTVDAADLDALPPDRWTLEADVEVAGVRRQGGFHRAIVSSSAALPHRPHPLPGSETVVTPSWHPEDGFGIVVEDPAEKPFVDKAPGPAAEVHQAALEDEIVLRVKLHGVTASSVAAASLTSPRHVVACMAATPEGDDVIIRFPVSESRFGGPILPLVHGTYSVELTLDDGQSILARVADGLGHELPRRDHSSRLDARWTTKKSGELRLTLLAPLSVDERGAWARTRLQQRYQTEAHAPENSVFFQCYRGEFATDSQRALHDELRRSRPDLTLYWGVADYATVVPEGGVPLLIGSAAWHDKLGSSRYLCNNIDFDSFFRKKPHQRYLQTFHGYPFKSMGASFWRGKLFSPGRVAEECERRNTEWDAILVPAEFCADFYRDEYAYDGEILAVGYPRTDALVNPGAQAVRTETRRRLGIAADKTVVLYAPTYRDKLTTRTFAAKRFDELDIERLCQRLGEGTVVLLRGHNNNVRELDRVRGHAQVIDVTDYPEINDLTLAADVAVLDYSSLRFDWAVTGKPMVFFVPDLEEYFDLRPPLFEFSASAPGPWARTTDEVIDLLADLPSVTSQYAEAMALFNKTYNAHHDGHASERVVAAFFGS